MNKKAKKLAEIYSSLPEDVASQLLDYAEFLQHRHPQVEDVPLAEPVLIERPENETVIAAVKRLSDSYPMLDSETLLHETSSLVSQHMLQGRDAVEVIDELEVIFTQQYDALIENNK